MSSNMTLEKIKRDLIEAVTQTAQPKTSPYDTDAVVKRVEGDTAYVHITGGVSETPVNLTIDAKKGDKVKVRVSGGNAWIIGNQSAPPTDDTTAVEVRQEVKKTNAVVKLVKTIAEQAQKIAGNTNQYFWHTSSGTDTGAHITEIPQEDFIDDPQNGGGNLLARSNGVAIRDGLYEIASFGEDITFSPDRPHNIGNSDSYISFDPDEGIIIGGEKTTMISPIDVFTWDMSLSVDERIQFNSDLDISEDTSTWTYDDITSSEMSAINTDLGISESTTSWDNDVDVSEYKDLCVSLEIGFQFGRSVYVGMDAISLGDSFFVDDDGHLLSTSGNIGGWDIGQDSLSNGVEGGEDYIELSGLNGIKLGKNFSVSPNGIIKARRGEIAGFSLVPVSNGNDYMVSDYTVGDITYRTWIRSAQTHDGGETWAFSTQYKRAGENVYRGAFIAKSNGELYSFPVDEDGVASGCGIHIRNSGVFLFNRTTVTNQPNIYRNPNTGEVNYTTWSSSSEQIKKNIKGIAKKSILPENLYDVDIVQFQYKDDFIDEKDSRSGEELVGFIIEDLAKKYPTAVDKPDKDDPTTWAWNSAYIIPPMLKLIQEQHKEIEELKKRVDYLEKGETK